MLKTITIKNYTLIKQLEINFEDGLNVITGETGAGKSIIIGAISLILGHRGNKDNIRSGTKKIEIQACFDVSGNEIIIENLTKMGIEIEDGLLIISRELDIKGKNQCLVNGYFVTVAQLKHLGIQLVDIHGQHEHNSLFDKKNHRKLLDTFIGRECHEILSRLEKSVRTLKELSKQIRAIEKKNHDYERRKEISIFERDEIFTAGLKPGEEQQLLSTKVMQENSEKLFIVSEKSKNLLNGDEERSEGILASLNELSELLSDISKINNVFVEFGNKIEAMNQDLKDLSYEVDKFNDLIDFDVGVLDETEKRLAELNSLKRKYAKDTIEDIIAYGDNLDEFISSAQKQDEILKDLQSQYRTNWKSYFMDADKLHALRMEHSKALIKAIESELKDLAMDKAKVSLNIIREQKLISSNGQDTVEIFITVNPGIPPKPISQVASGGEISRIMLAIKSVFGAKDDIGTMIFDEIDTGISGRTAQKVAEKILVISKLNQVICITHLPQITAMADKHFQVVKYLEDNTTSVQFNELSKLERVEELARMLGGAIVTQTTLKHAEEMLELTKKIKKN